MSDLTESDFEADCWSDWLTYRRHGGDPEHEPIVRAAVAEIRDRVLDGARLASGMTLLDIGAGDRLISFEALRRVKQPFLVILSDISTHLLKRAERIATEIGFRDQCRFLQSSAETLAGVADESVDVITSRAALAYVVDKLSAARSFLRVLRPGGRLSLGEPLGQDAAVQLAALTKVLQSQPANSNTPYLALLQRCRSLQMPSTLDGIRSNPFTNYSERDLVQIFRKAGFVNIHMEFHMDVKAGPAMPWSTFIEIAPRPGTPSLREIFEQDFTAADISLLERGMRKAVEDGTLTGQTTNVYLTAEKALPWQGK
jgi:ubiquinone/menaquinone biosynthesis C-methylase UbiE